MNAQLPQIVNENVFPNGCSFGGRAVFRGVGYSWQLLCWNMTHSTSGNDCDLHSDVYEFCRNWVISLTILFFCWCAESLSTILGNKSSDGKRKVQGLQREKIKGGIFFPILCQILLEWDKNQYQDNQQEVICKTILVSYYLWLICSNGFRDTWPSRLIPYCLSISKHSWR